MADTDVSGTRLPPKSSRIFIRNLPSTSFKALQKHFTQFSEFTDCRYFPDRRIAFVGYRTPEQAEAAVKYFDRSYIKTSRLSVEIAKSARDDGLGKSWSGKAIKSNNTPTSNFGYEPVSPAKVLKRKRDETEPSSKPEKKPLDINDPKYKEYMQLMQSSSNRKIWENETAIINEEQIRPAPTVMDESEDEYEDLSSRRKSEKLEDGKVESIVMNKSLTRSNDESATASSEAAEDVDMNVLPDIAGQAQAVSDVDWLKSRTNRITQTENGTIDSSTDNGTEQVALHSLEAILAEDDDVAVVDNEVSKSEEPSRTEDDDDETDQDPAIKRISETGRLFLRNLTYTITEEEITELFGTFGELEEVHLPFDPKIQKPKGFAYVLFSDPECAVEAFRTLDQQIFQGRNLHILPGEAKREQKLDDYALSKLPLKKQREILKKRSAGKSDFEWNSLYMNINSVMASMADRLGVDKAELLDPTSSDAAVKQAHAETRVIQETKSYFEKHGINLAAFAKKKRGDKIVLIKNFAYGTTHEELKTLCNEFGDTKRILMPPAGTIAIVEYSDDPSGRSAFTKLYGRKFKDSILKVEKGPEDLFIKLIDPTIPDKKVEITSGNIGKPSIQDILASTDQVSQPGETASLFVKNLNFATTSDKLKDLFVPLDGYMSARVKTKLDPKNPGQTLSMGYGFVEFRSREQAASAQAAMNGYFLDGHKLEIKGSHRAEDAVTERRNADEAKRKNAAGTKITIKNLAFEVSEKQLRNLFGQYGKLKSVRLPKKFNRTSRGFGFAQFVSNKEAENAMEALKHTHLHGRPLILEWAKEDAKDAEEEIQRLQKKVGRQADSVRFAKLSGAAGRKKFNIEDAEAGADEIED